MTTLWRGFLFAAMVVLGAGIIAPVASAATAPTATAGQAFANQVLAEATLPPGTRPTSTVVTPELALDASGQKGAHHEPGKPHRADQGRLRLLKARSGRRGLR